MQAIETTLEATLAEAEAAVRAALEAEGFGVLTEVDVAATLADALGVHRRALKILGACNPAVAHRALELEASLALVLPCNVVLEDAGGGRTRVAVADPRALLVAGGGELADADELDELAYDAAVALERAIRRLSPALR
ncbi:MAG: DUF302 domain-containing protein [Actinomycetota bacterium]|jgi:uncharacterized protein (DUF302 family)|nr:DUF302 domain-containing protein [Actinomycetota bacterium]